MRDDYIWLTVFVAAILFAAAIIYFGPTPKYVPLQRYEVEEKITVETCDKIQFLHFNEGIKLRCVHPGNEALPEGEQKP